MTNSKVKVSKSKIFHFPQRLQWRLTAAYALFTALTALAFGIIGVALWWYLTFQVWVPNTTADTLNRAAELLSPYLDGASVNQSGLNRWLNEMVAFNRQTRRPPGSYEDKGDSPDGLMFRRLDRAVALVVVDAAGELLLSYPDESYTPDEPISAQISAEGLVGFEAALAGETDSPARNADGYIVVSAPILNDDGEVLGAIYAEVDPPIRMSDFFQRTVQQTILPIVWAVLIVGGVAGVLFGHFIAKNLTRRLDALAGASDAWSKGDFDVLVVDDTGDEVSRLAQRLNRMALQLQSLLQTRQELASMDERNRLARDLHDAVKQQVFATSMQVGAALTFFDQNPEAARKSLTEADRLVRQTQQELGSLIAELRPAALEDKGLTAALRETVNDWSRQNSIAVDFRVCGEQSLPLLMEQALFRITQEALANIARHSGATTAEVHLAWQDDRIVLTISDNGQGFDPNSPRDGGLGLRSMRERVAAIGGEISVTSPPEGGTQVQVQCDNPSHR